MRIVKVVLVYLGITLFISTSAQAQEWRKIIPLRSTRADVERLLGPADDKVLALYKFRDEVVTIQFTEDRCNREIGQDWNVPIGTVVNITVASRYSQPFVDLQVDKTKLTKKDDPEGASTNYIDEEKGITYVVSSTGDVRYINYGPKAKDNYLRCPSTSKKSSRLC